jgi:hypothetical protein
VLALLAMVSFTLTQGLKAALQVQKESGKSNPRSSLLYVEVFGKSPCLGYQ